MPKLTRDQWIIAVLSAVLLALALWVLLYSRAFAAEPDYTTWCDNHNRLYESGGGALWGVAQDRTCGQVAQGTISEFTVRDASTDSLLPSR